MMACDHDETGNEMEIDQEQGSDDDDEFGQKLPPLHVNVKRVLDKYPEGGQILKELLQNADDAGASEIIFLHDKTQHPTDHMWSQSLQKFNGPALYVYNNATFKDSDWRNIQHPEQSGKHDDPTKVGRFGLGFISVYHISDMPSIFSSRYIGFLDPNETYFVKDPITGVVEKGKRGKKWCISQKLLEPGLKDQFSPYLDPIFKCNEETFKNGYYDGTIFRFPFRADEDSKISRAVYDEARVQSLFQSFKRDAEISLLFLKNVMSVAVYEKRTKDEPANLVFKVEVSPEDKRDLQLERSRFLQDCQKEAADGVSRCRANITQRMPFQVEQPATCDEYLIVNILKRTGLSQGMQDLLKDKDLKQLPWVGLAMKIAPVVGTSGRMFCFLPLPENECSHLPAYVHGYFGLGDNRRSIKWPDQESQHDNAAQWNIKLVEEVFPEAYVELIMMAIEKGIPASTVYEMWPDVNSLTGPWEDGVKLVIKKLGVHSVLYTEMKGGSWQQPKDVFIDIEQNSLLHKILLKKERPVVHVPANVLEALRWSGIKFREVTPALIRKVVRGDTLEWLDRDEKLQLLEYILRDKQFSDLDNIHLLPLQDGSFVPFTTSAGQSIYIPNAEVPRHLFPNMETSLTAVDCPDILKKAEGFTQLSNLTVGMVPPLLRRCLPEEWRGGKDVVTWEPGLEDQPQSDWLENFWLWLEKADISLEEFESLPLIQVGSSTRQSESRDEKKRKKRKVTRKTFQLAPVRNNRLIYQKPVKCTSAAPQLTDSVCDFLESIGAIVVRNALPSFISKNRDISKFIQSADGEGVMQILTDVSSDDMVTQMKHGKQELRRDLLTLLASTTPTCQQRSLLKKLPLFQASNGKFVNAEKCLKGVQRGYHGIPIQKVDELYILLDGSSTPLAATLGVKEESQEDFLRSCVLPSVESRFYSKQERLTIMNWVLENGHLHYLVKSLKFIPTSDKSLSAPDQLFDPGNPLMTALYNKKPMFPTEKYASGRLLVNIRRVGLREESSISAKEILEIAKEVTISSDHKRGHALLDYICKYPKLLSDKATYQPLGTLLNKIAWVSCERSPPSGYPTSLPWFGKSKTLLLSCPDEVRLIGDAHLLGSIVPLVQIPDDPIPGQLCEYFGWTNDLSSIPVKHVLQHLKNVASSSGDSQYDKTDISHTMSAIYNFLAEVPDQDELKHHFSEGGIMTKVPWVWYGRGFSTPDKVAFQSKVSGGNFLHKISSKVQKFRKLLLHLGVRDAFTTEDYIGVLQEVKDKRKNAKVTDEKKVVQEILHAIIDDKNLQAYHDRLYALDFNCVLRKVDQLKYNDDNISPLSDDLDKFIDVHHSLTSRQVKLLGIRNCREIQMDRCSTDHGFERPFGQREKLTTRLRGILREYSHTPDVLKELLQNADDAGATELHIVYDPRRHPGKRITGDKWQPMHNAPALCVYNDKPFTDEDIEGIQNVGVGGKISDATTTGRFGIGFNAVYHLTDCPTFLTQDTSKLCIFDPHVKYVPRATSGNPGKLYSLEGPHGCQVTFPDMTQGYLIDYGEFDMKNGTMFRFPLRGPEMKHKSEISDEVYTREKVETLLTEFERTSEDALLFLNSVQKISISEIHPKTGRLKQRYSVSADISQEDKKRRSDIGAQLQKYQDRNDNANIVATQSNQVYRLHLTERRKGKRQRTKEWLVSQTIGVENSQLLSSVQNETKEFMTKMFIPRGGAAALLNDDMSSGKAFCVLPLPIETDLPVHINGTLALDHARRNLKKGDGSMIHRWNQVLAEHVIAPAYASLLDEAGEILYESLANLQNINGMWVNKQYDSLFPTNLDTFQGVWKVIAMSTLKYIANNNLHVFPVVRSPDDDDKDGDGEENEEEDEEQEEVKEDDVDGEDDESDDAMEDEDAGEEEDGVDDTEEGEQNGSNVDWYSPQDSVQGNALFDNLADLDEKSSPRKGKSRIVRCFLQRAKFNLISCSADICNAFRAVDINTKYVSAEACCQHLRENKIAKAFPIDISKTKFLSISCPKVVLEYCINGIHKVDNLLKLPFQLDGKNMLGIFSDTNAKYFSNYYSLLPSCQGLFLHIDIKTVLSKVLHGSNLERAYLKGILRKFTVHELAKHISSDGVLPRAWKHSNQHVVWRPKLKTHPNARWLQTLWKFLCIQTNNFELKALEDWPIIPTTDRKLVSLKMAKTVLFLDSYRSEEVLSALQNLDCPVVDVKKMAKPGNLQQHSLHSILRTYLATPHKHDDVLSVVQYMIEENRDLSGRLTPVECDTLLQYFNQAAEDQLNKDQLDTLRHLPIFLKSKSKYKSKCYVSIHEFQHWYTLSETLTIPGIDVEEWMEDEGCIFLQYDTKFVTVYEYLGIERIGAMYIYEKFVFPHLDEFPQPKKVQHIKFIRDTLLPKISWEQRKNVLDILRKTKFIPGEDEGEFHEASYFFNISNEVFKKMVMKERFLPGEFRTTEWEDFLLQIGLQDKVTGDLCIKFAKEIETSSHTIRTRKKYQDLQTKSMSLLSAFKSNASDYETKTLKEIATIEFIPSEEIDDERKQIHPEFNMTQSSSSKFSNKFVCFKGSVPATFKDLVWSVAPCLPTLVVPFSTIIKQSLGIEAEPPIGKVLQHVENVCSKMVKHNAYDKEDALAVRSTLIEVVGNSMAYLNKKLASHEEEIQRGLKDSPICLVEGGMVLVKARQLVFEISRSTENQLKPYLYKADPWDLGQCKEVLQALGAQDEVTFDQLAMMLDEIQQECNDKKMVGNELKKAHCATGLLFDLLQSTNGQCPIAVTKLYLPTSVRKMSLSTKLHYTDLNEFEARYVPFTSDTEFIVPLKQLLAQQQAMSHGWTEEKLIQLLPPCLQPKKITTQEKPLDTNVPCGCTHCPLVSQIRSIVNSDETQEVLLRLIQHQTEKAPDSGMMKNIVKLKDFNSFICTQELKTGYFDIKGKLVGEREVPRDVILVKNNEQATMYFSHTDVSDHVESGSVFFLPLARSINLICELNLNPLHVQYLSQVLALPSITLKNRFLAECNIPLYDNTDDELSTNPGSIVPDDILCLLDDSMTNKFNPGDIAVYKQHHEDGTISHIYVKILERLPITGETTETSMSMLRKYKIDVGEGTSQEVSVVELFMFRRTREDTTSSKDEVSVVERSQSSSSSGSSSSRARTRRSNLSEGRASDIATAKAQIRKAVKEAMMLPEAQRKECLRRLYRMWHPDKNPDQVELATQAFQFLQQEIQRVTNNSKIDETYSEWNEDITRDRQNEHRYQFFRQQYQQHHGTSSAHDFTRSQFFPQSFKTTTPDPRKAKLWYRQAEEDLKTAKQYQRKNTAASQSWTALMIQQSAEKALKALIFHLDGTQSFSHNLSVLLTVACQYSPAKKKETQLRDVINQLVQLRCDAIRSRYPEDGTNRTTGEVYEDFNSKKALQLCQTLLGIVDKILSN